MINPTDNPTESPIVIPVTPPLLESEINDELTNRTVLFYYIRAYISLRVVFVYKIPIWLLAQARVRMSPKMTPWGKELKC